MRKPLIDATGLVVNIIEIDDGADWTPPTGHTLLAANPAAIIGGHYDSVTGVFTPPPPPPAPPVDPRVTLLGQLADAGIITAAITAGVTTTATATAAGVTAAQLATQPTAGIAAKL